MYYVRMCHRNFLKSEVHIEIFKNSGSTSNKHTSPLHRSFDYDIYVINAVFFSEMN